ncbi:MAG TPA: ABC transporter ATP-binding protein [Candidatus Acidoferrum sp.]|nr:ABC transporter ATP-binding protein [Candidatus Acidoferrum sp.]
MTKREELVRLLRYVMPYKIRLAVGIVCLSVVGLSEGLIALMIAPIFDRVLNPQAPDSRLLLIKNPLTHESIYLNSFLPSQIHSVGTLFSIAILVLFIGKGVAEFLGNLLVQNAGIAGVTDLRNQVYAKLIRQPIGFFQDNPTGRLLSTVINDVERVRSTISEYMALGFRHVFTLFFLLAVLLATSWKMTLGSMVLLPMVVWPVRTLGKRIRRSTEKIQAGLGELSQILEETVSGNRVVKAFGMEDFEIGKFRDAARRLLRENMRWIRSVVVTSPIMDLLGAVVIVLLLMYARGQVKAGAMTGPIFLTFVYALFKSYEPVKGLGAVYQQFELAFGATAKVFEYIGRAGEPTAESGMPALAPVSRSVEFDRVSFGYDPELPILRDISLQARAGEVIAIVGSSGAGKTTLVNLLPRFYPVTSGSLRIDGVDVREVTLRSLREQMAIVTQETILFNDTVWNNICYGRPGLPKDRVETAAQAALAHDFILELPQGYQTMLGDRGQRLSGGQRQRIAIARAILKDSPILILDEATSELDSESEMLVQRALSNLMMDRTAFVIAHRLSTIRRADKIIVIENGTIAETGTHQELLARAGIYARLYEIQFADLEDAATPAPKANR